jgi:hypothetical protein
MRVQDFLLGTRAPAVTILIRLMVGTVFLSEGIQKFLFIVPPRQASRRCVCRASSSGQRGVHRQPSDPGDEKKYQAEKHQQVRATRAGN